MHVSITNYISYDQFKELEKSLYLLNLKIKDNYFTKISKYLIII